MTLSRRIALIGTVTRRRGNAACAITFSIALTILSAAGSAAEDRSGGGAKAASPVAARLPANYRMQIAAYIKAHNRYVIRDAKITKPYERYGGLFRGGTVPAVCVAIFRDNPLGIVVRDNWVMSYEDGRIQQIGMGMESCSDLSEFTELKSR